MNCQNFVIIVAAGVGLRMGSTIKKQYLCLNKTPILTHTIKVFDKCDYIHEIILVVPEQDKDYCKINIIDHYEFKKKIHVVQGGKTRQDSVFSGLKYLDELLESAKKNIVMIHDGVRPFVDDAIIANCINSAIKNGASIPAVKITDTIKQINPDLSVQKTLDRELVYCAQTPQTFKLDLILKAYERAIKINFTGTDDASLMENAGHKVNIVAGSKHNIKITTPEDLVLGKYLLTLNLS